MIIIHFKIIIIKININNDNNKLKSDQLLLLDSDIIIIVDIIDNIISDNYCCWIAVSCYCYSKMVQTETKLAIRYYSTADDQRRQWRSLILPSSIWLLLDRDVFGCEFLFYFIYFFIFIGSLFSKYQNVNEDSIAAHGNARMISNPPREISFPFSKLV